MELTWSGAKGALRWKARFNIALGIAEGLFYLHEGCHRHIIHRDIKASNILLTEYYQPQVRILLLVCYTSPPHSTIPDDVNWCIFCSLIAQISDFGLAKWLPDKCTHQVVFPIEGTFGWVWYVSEYCFMFMITSYFPVPSRLALASIDAEPRASLFSKKKKKKNLPSEPINL